MIMSKAFNMKQHVNTASQMNEMWAGWEYYCIAVSDHSFCVCTSNLAK